MKTAGGCDIDWISLQRESSTGLFQQLFDALRAAILSGRLQSGNRLPSTRLMASQLKVSRNTVASVYEQLVAEGYLCSQRGSGTRVVDSLPGQKPVSQNSPQSKAPSRQPSSKRPALLSPSLPATEAFPVNIWKRLGNQVYRQFNTSSWMDYGEAAGFWPLRECIADYLIRQRGLVCTHEQILIVNGAQQALDLTSRLLLNENDSIWLEDPCYQGARNVFDRSGISVNAIPVDRNGMDVDYALNQDDNAKLAFVTPSHQYPLGSVLSLRRRLQLLDWAKQKNSWIIEDDYGGEYRYTGKPLMALQGLDNHQRVIYLGSFSKVLFPSLRLAYMVLPEELIEKFVGARALIDMSPATFPQIQLSEFIRQGYFTAHIRKMRSLYAERMAELERAVKRHIPEMSLLKCNSGMHATGLLTEINDDQALERQVRAVGLRTPALSKHYFREPLQYGLLLGFASTPEDKIQPAIVSLKEQIKILQK